MAEIADLFETHKRAAATLKRAQTRHRKVQMNPPNLRDYYPDSERFYEDQRKHEREVARLQQLVEQAAERRNAAWRACVAAMPDEDTAYCAEDAEDTLRLDEVERERGQPRCPFCLGRDHDDIDCPYRAFEEER